MSPTDSSTSATFSSSNENASNVQHDLEQPLLAGNGETNAEISPSLPSFGRLLGLGRPECGVLVLAMVFMVASQVAQLITPQLVGHAYDALVNPTLINKVSKINQTMILVLLLHLGGLLLGFGRTTLMGVAGERIVARLRIQVYERILKQEIAFFDEHKSGELVSRLGSDATVLKQAVSRSVPSVLVGLVRLVAAISLMVHISPRLASVTLSSTFALFLLVFPFGRALGKLSKAYQDVLGQAQTMPTEAIGAMRTVQSFCAEEREGKRYSDKIGQPQWCPNSLFGGEVEKTTFSVGVQRSLLEGGFYSLIFGLGFAAMYVSLWYGFILVENGSISLGQLTAFQTYIFQIGSTLGTLSSAVSSVMEARGASTRIFFLLDREPKIPSSTIGDNEGSSTIAMIPNKPLEGSVQFKNVSFAYPSRPHLTVLRDFNLDVAPNTTVALVGSSGSGKSTTVALIQRFYEVTGGSICMDGMDIRNLNLKWMRQHIGYVQQEPQLFGMTIRENVAYGLERHVSDDEVWQACRKANADVFVSQWPEGLDTMVGERGVKLSGGQKQRLAIARAILIDPRILLLDEATSALDAESEHLVQRAIDAASQGRTVLIVAHRLSTIRGADQIVVFDDHTICDVGTHDELLNRCEVYQNLIQRQSVMNNGENGTTIGEGIV